jgi:hypothetical protein
VAETPRTASPLREVIAGSGTSAGELCISRLGDASHFIAALRGSQSPDELSRIMEEITSEMGFTSYWLIQNVKDFSSRFKRFSISNHRREWIDQSAFDTRILAG